MSEFPTPTVRWTIVAAMALAAPIAVGVGWQADWLPGVAPFTAFVVPVLLVALAGGRLDACVAAVIAVVATTIDVWLRADASLIGLCAWGGVASGLFASVVMLATRRVETAEKRIKELEAQNEDYVRRIYARSREAELAAVEKEPAKAKSGQDEIFEDIDVNCGLLLLSLQDIGRRVSSHLAVESLLPEIISTAKSALKCKECRLFAFDGQSKTFSDMLPGRKRSAGNYEPRADAGMAGWVVRHKQILTRREVETNYELQALLDEDPHMPDGMAPLIIGEQFLGLLVVDQASHLSPTFTRLLYVLASTYSLSIKNAQLFTRIEEMARRDGLTGLLNHASFQESVGELFAEAREGKSTVSVIMSDIDHFKKFNDTWGHQAGDHVLREVSKLWKAVLPDHAILARYGGEEFICALPGEDMNRAAELAELLRSHTEERALDFEGQELRVTSSFGVSQFQESLASHEELVKIADEALYRAKEAGRNRVERATPRAAAANGTD